MAKKDIRRNADFNDSTDSYLWQEELAKFLSIEDWHEVGATGEPAFQNSWVNFGSPYTTAAFYKDSFNRIHLKGVVKSGTVDTTIFTLPVGYRPAKEGIFSANGGGITHVRLDISTTGGVGTISSSINSDISLDGISFRAA